MHFLSKPRFIALLIFLTLTVVNGFAQSSVKVSGIVQDSTGNPIPDAQIVLNPNHLFYTSNENGYYSFSIPANQSAQIQFSYLGAQPVFISIDPTPAGVSLKRNIIIPITVQLNGITVQEERDRDKTAITLDPHRVKMLPNISGNFEQLIKTLPGVASNNELSSQYNVRGGNFDENLVYVNDIEIYRPFLPRSGQQEGLSFIHTALVQQVKFSAGGFEARYGDKMSSVLDVKYKEPVKSASSISIGLMGVQAASEGASKNLRFTWLLGARYWSNKLAVSTFDVRGDYRPQFTDVQTLLTYHFTDKLSLSVLGSYAQNQYFMIPTDQQTSFGTVKQALQLNVYFNGADMMNYITSTAASSLVYKPTNHLQLKWISSAFYTNENEYFTIEGAYRMNELETNLGSDNFSKARKLRGIGYFINNARNTLEATVFNTGHRGYYNHKDGQWQWGCFIQNENIYDKLHEWNYRDSAGFAQPTLNANGDFVLPDYLNTKLTLSTFRINGYFQHTQLLNKTYNLIVTYGLRSNWWSYNLENVISPRLQFAFEPNRRYNRSEEVLKGKLKRKADWVIKGAYGWYYQPPFYRELRNFQGELNPAIRAQKAIHYVLSGDVVFKAWNRPFKFVSEAYYKQLENLIPYEIDNVRIRYFAENSSKGYATGIDFRINGEFVKGAESWFTLGFMDTKEIIQNQYDANGVLIPAHYISRPSNQLMRMAIQFQDYFPNNPSYKVNLNLVFGTPLPFGPPDHNRYNDLFEGSSYRRLDIGFVKDLMPHIKKQAWAKSHIKDAWISFDIFNILGINNTVSYTWLDDAQGNRWAVPNYLTSRLANLKMMIAF